MKPIRCERQDGKLFDVCFRLLKFCRLFSDFPSMHCSRALRLRELPKVSHFLMRFNVEWYVEQFFFVLHPKITTFVVSMLNRMVLGVGGRKSWAIRDETFCMVFMEKLLIFINFRVLWTFFCLPAFFFLLICFLMIFIQAFPRAICFGCMKRAVINEASGKGRRFTPTIIIYNSNKTPNLRMTLIKIYVLFLVSNAFGCLIVEGTTVELSNCFYSSRNYLWGFMWMKLSWRTFCLW